MTTHLTPQTKWQTFTLAEINEFAEDDEQAAVTTVAEALSYLEARGDNFVTENEDGTLEVLFG